MGGLLAVAIIAAAFFAAVPLVALALIASAPPPPSEQRDIFGFGAREAPGEPPPPLRRWRARDGEQLAFRFYDSAADRVLIFIHGSSYHGAAYHTLAARLSAAGAAKVVLPNLRGHFQSGARRGDVDYIGQLEDDLVDLIAWLRTQGVGGPIVVGGHSSGGGLAVRFAGGPHGRFASGFLLASPIIPTSPAVKEGTAGGWANLHLRRLFGFLILNALGAHGFDALPIIAFNKPTEFWDGTETLSYSHRLNASMHPRYPWRKDVAALPERVFVLVGAKDQAVDALALRDLFARKSDPDRVAILDGVDHFGVFRAPEALAAMESWLLRFPAV